MGCLSRFSEKLPNKFKQTSLQRLQIRIEISKILSRYLVSQSGHFKRSICTILFRLESHHSLLAPYTITDHLSVTKCPYSECELFVKSVHRFADIQISNAWSSSNASSSLKSLLCVLIWKPETSRCFSIIAPRVSPASVSLVSHNSHPLQWAG